MSDQFKTLTYKEAIFYSTKIIRNKCGDGLMKDVMKVCVHWFIKILYGDGLIFGKVIDSENKPQLELFKTEFKETEIVDSIPSTEIKT